MAGKSGKLELRTRISHVGMDGREYRVIRPDRPAPRLVLHDESLWYSGFADLDAFKQLTVLWALAAASPRSIVYVPMRQNLSRFQGHSVDLVLSYASLQLRPSRWKAIRARLGSGAAHTARLPAPDPDEEPDYSRMLHREYRDVLNFDNAGDTVFVTGGRESFRRAAVRLSALPQRTIGRSIADPHHLCVEITIGAWSWSRAPTRHNTPGMLHFQYEPGGW
ncbi:hypothetical protein KGQ19_15320 [Catenulispora sp. NL8]|uniref:Uncharacterized protein n=1 Tax=Catenulispora pinistramenti TaxID=2705254 RepID=A0ABS5KQD0_9ACTN|nr:hypothetical protein [Catenulispora pinistramenti]MBS2548235.1 hypothetical protein [Catenulispora pinistramenti]